MHQDLSRKYFKICILFHPHLYGFFITRFHVNFSSRIKKILSKKINEKIIQPIEHLWKNHNIIQDISNNKMINNNQILSHYLSIRLKVQLIIPRVFNCFNWSNLQMKEMLFFAKAKKKSESAEKRIINKKK